MYVGRAQQFNSLVLIIQNQIRERGPRSSHFQITYFLIFFFYFSFNNNKKKCGCIYMRYSILCLKQAHRINVLSTASIGVPSGPSLDAIQR